jgi:hypothetical protein
LAELAAGIFFQRFMRPMVLKQKTDEELVKKLLTSSYRQCLITLSAKCLRQALFLAIL